MSCVGLCLIVSSHHSYVAVAQEKKGPRTDLPPALAERLVKEGDAREACKKLICEAARSKKAEGDPLSCKVVKTWPAKDLKDKISQRKTGVEMGSRPMRSRSEIGTFAGSKGLERT